MKITRDFEETSTSEKASSIMPEILIVVVGQTRELVKSENDSNYKYLEK